MATLRKSLLKMAKEKYIAIHAAPTAMNAMILQYVQNATKDFILMIVSIAIVVIHHVKTATDQIVPHVMNVQKDFTSMEANAKLAIQIVKHVKA